MKNLDSFLWDNPLNLALPIFLTSVIPLFWLYKDVGLLTVYLGTIVALFWILTWILVKLS